MKPFAYRNIIWVLLLIFSACDKNAGTIIPAMDFEETVNRANRGDVKAANRLTWHYEYGLYDQERATFWRRKAASLGDTNAQMYLFHENINSTDNAVRQEAMEYLKTAAMRGNASGRRELSERYFSGNGIKRDLKEGRRWLQLAAEAKDIQSMFVLSEHIIKEKPGVDGYAEAYAWVNMARKEVPSGTWSGTEARRRLSAIVDAARAKNVQETELISEANVIEKKLRNK